MHSERFQNLLTYMGLDGTVYFDDSHRHRGCGHHDRAEMAGLRTELERQGAGHELLRRLELAVTEQRPAVGRGSRVVVANADGVLVDQHLSEGEGTLHARVSELPYIVPALEAGADGAGYLVVVVDHAGADIELHRGEDEKETAIATTVEGAGFPVHKAGRADTPGYGDPQQRTEENRSRNIRAVADKVTAPRRWRQARRGVPRGRHRRCHRGELGRIGHRRTESRGAVRVGRGAQPGAAR